MSITNDSNLQIIDPTPGPDSAFDALERFLARLSKHTRVGCLHDSDADGIAAGVLWQRSMERLGFHDIIRVMPDRDRNAWSSENRERAASTRAGALFVLDLGSQQLEIVPGLPSCFIDHHRPEGVSSDVTLIGAYSWIPTPNTSLIVFELFRRLTVIDDLEWISAVGTISDLGEKAPFTILESAKKRYTARYLREATTLVNAARRASAYVPEVAAQALLEHKSPRSLVEADDADAKVLRAARVEVKAAMEEAKKSAPKFAGSVALIRTHSSCQVHPLLAQIWRSRLPGFVVIAANDGYVEGKVYFSARS